MQNQINKATKILIIPDSRTDLDLICSTYAIAYELEKIGKEVKILKNDSNFPDRINKIISSGKLQFIEKFRKGDFVISLKSDNAKIQNVRWEQAENGRINILITTQEGEISKESPTFLNKNEEFDLIILLGFTNLGRIGDFYLSNTEHFKKEKLLLINYHDNKSPTENVFINNDVSSLSELIFEFFKSNEVEFDKVSANYLMQGIYWRTESLRERVEVNTFEVLTNLHAKGADISKAENIFKSLTLIESKAIQNILKNVKITKKGIAFSSIDATELNNVDLISSLFKDWNMIKYLLEARVSVVILTQKDFSWVTINSTSEKIPADIIAREFREKGSKSKALFKSEKSIQEIQDIINMKIDMILDDTKDLEQKLKSDSQKYHESRKKNIVESKTESPKTESKNSSEKQSQPSPTKAPSQINLNEARQTMQPIDTNNGFKKTYEANSNNDLNDPLVPAKEMPQAIQIGKDPTKETEKPKFTGPLPPAE